MDALIESDVPAPGPSGPAGTMPWLRASVSRFAVGDEHRRRRARVVALLATLDPEDLRAAAAARPTDPYVPVAVLAAALGVGEEDAPAAVAATRTVAAAYHPGTSAPGADAALGRLLDLLPDDDRVTRVTLLVQSCEATAALIRGGGLEPPPVPATKRQLPDGSVVVVPLTGRPFGAGPRACPARAHALALAAGVAEAQT